MLLWTTSAMNFHSKAGQVDPNGYPQSVWFLKRNVQPLMNLPQLSCFLAQALQGEFQQYSSRVPRAACHLILPRL